MRGKRAEGDEFQAYTRITPAHAGKTAWILFVPASCQDHPRACGENLRALARRSRPKGSPPRMRGKLRVRIAVGVIGRITPAYAGKTGLAMPSPPSREDHPRVCGENAPYFVKFSSPGGSPPRMRGKRHPEAYLLRARGITPAYTGKTACR